MGALSSSLGLTLYSSGMVLGRLVLTKLPEHWRDIQILKGCVAGAMGFLLSVILSPSYIAKLVLFLMVGFFIGGDWPILLTYSGRRFPDRTGEITGYLLVGSGMGGLAFPPAMGFLGEQVGIWALMAGPLVPLVGLLTVAWTLRQAERREEIVKGGQNGQA